MAGVGTLVPPWHRMCMSPGFTDKKEKKKTHRTGCRQTKVRQERRVRKRNNEPESTFCRGVKSSTKKNSPAPPGAGAFYEGPEAPAPQTTGPQTGRPGEKRGIQGKKRGRRGDTARRRAGLSEERVRKKEPAACFPVVGGGRTRKQNEKNAQSDDGRALQVRVQYTRTPAQSKKKIGKNFQDGTPQGELEPNPLEGNEKLGT